MQGVIELLNVINGISLSTNAVNFLNPVSFSFRVDIAEIFRFCNTNENIECPVFFQWRDRANKGFMANDRQVFV